MKRNTLLMTAVWIALGGAGVASAQTSEDCATQATQLKAQIEASNLADSDRAKLESSLSEAQSADMARCEQIVSRVSRDLTAGSKAGIVNPETGSDYSSSQESKPSSAEPKQPSSATGDQTSATSPTAEQPDYQEGHAAAAESLPARPGADDTATDPASTTMQDEGYASPQQTMSGTETPSDTSGGVSTDTTGSSAETADATVAAAGGARMSSDEAKQTQPSGTASSALASMTTKDLVDKPVKATNGKEVGEIESVVIDRTPEGHGFAVVSVGGVLGLGETKVVVDLDKLQLTADGSIQAQVADEDEIKGYTRYNEAHYQQYQGDLSRLM